MSAGIPAWTAVATALLALGGALLALIGSIGLLRLRSFYERVHPPTMATTLGTGLVLLGSMLFSTVHEGRPIVHEILIAVFMTVTTPVTFALLVRAALHRDCMEGRDPTQQEARRETRKEEQQ